MNLSFKCKVNTGFDFTGDYYIGTGNLFNVSILPVDSIQRFTAHSLLCVQYPQIRRNWCEYQNFVWSWFVIFIAIISLASNFSCYIDYKCFNSVMITNFNKVHCIYFLTVKFYRNEFSFPILIFHTIHNFCKFSVKPCAIFKFRIGGGGDTVCLPPWSLPLRLS